MKKYYIKYGSSPSVIEVECHHVKKQHDPSIGWSLNIGEAKFKITTPPIGVVCWHSIFDTKELAEQKLAEDIYFDTSK